MRPILVRPFACAVLTAAIAAGLFAQSATPPPLSPPPSPQQKAQTYYQYELAAAAIYEAETHNGADPYVNQALDALRAARASDPNSIYLGTQLAEFLFRAQHYDEAVALDREIVAQHPDSVEAHELLGLFFQRMIPDPSDSQYSARLGTAVDEYATLVKLEPADPQPHLVLAGLYQQQKQPAAAEREFRAALAVAPADDDAISGLVDALNSEGTLGDPQQVAATLPEAARTAHLYFALGGAYRQQRKWPQAIAAFTQATVLQPDDPENWDGLGQSQLSNGDVDAAAAAYQKAVQADDGDSQGWLRLAEIAQQRHDYGTAQSDLDRAAAGAPDSAEIQYTRAMLDENQGNLAAAITQLQALLSATSNADNDYTPAQANNRGIFLERLGLAQQRQGDATAALASFKQMETLGGGSQLRAQEREIGLYQSQREYTQAETTAQAATAAHPHSRALHLVYANLLAEEGKTEAAITQIQPLMSGNASDFGLYIALGQVHEDARDFTAANADAAQASALATNDGQRTQAARLTAEVAEKQGDYPAAEAALRRALQLTPNDGAALNLLAYVLAESNSQLDQASQLIGQALKQQPDNGTYLDSLGFIYFQQKKYSEAVSALERAASLSGDDPNVQEHLAEAYYASGKLQQAEASYQRELDAWQKSPPALADAQKIAAAQRRLAEVQAKLKQN